MVVVPDALVAVQELQDVAQLEQGGVDGDVLAALSIPEPAYANRAVGE